MKNFFRENRFVFDGRELDAEGKPKVKLGSATEKAQKVLDATAKREGGEEAAKAEGEVERAKEKTTLQTMASLKAFKSEVEGAKDGRAFSQLQRALDLSGKTISGYLKGGDILEEFVKQQGDLASEFKKLIKEKDLSAVAEFFESTEEEAEEVFAALYGSDMVGRLTSHYGVSYDEQFEAFKKTPVGKKAEIKKYKIIFTADGKYSVELGEKKMRDAFEQYKLDHPVGEETVVDGANAAKETLPSLEDQPIGGLLRLLGYGKKDDNGVTGFDKIANGEADGIVAIILGIFGYTEYGGEAYAGLKDLIPERFSSMKSRLEKWEKKARGSKYAFGAKKGVGKGKEKGKEGVPSYQLVGKNEFLIMVEKGTLPQSGVKLKEAVQLTDAKLAIDFSKGGSVIVPSGGNVRHELKGGEVRQIFARGSDEKIDSDDRRSKDFILVGQIYTGTVFVGDLGVERV